MPELPEVEVVRRGLAQNLPGRRISQVVVSHERPVRRHLPGAADFAETLVGREFATPNRRGKYLWLPFADGDALVAHLGMSGQFRWDAPSLPMPRNTRIQIRFHDTDSELRFVDQRMFGGMWVSPGGAELPSELNRVARDLFDPDLDRKALAARISSRRSPIKRLLLDQSVVSGIGNIYADEALWRAQIHPETPAEQLSVRKIEELLDQAHQVMRDALAEGGTSFDALYVNVSGESGYFARSLNVYGRQGEACLRCGSQIRRIPFAGRSSHYCPDCQRAP